MKYIGKIFEQYPVNFPIDNELTIIHGANGSGKTQILNLLNEYFTKERENILFFPYNRILTIKDEQLLSVYTMLKVIGENDLFSKYGLKYELVDNLNAYYEYPIFSGFFQLINFVCNIMLGPDNQIVLIDEIENNLSITIQRNLIKDLIEIKKIKKLIVTTHSPSILSDLWIYAVNANDCVQL